MSEERPRALSAPSVILQVHKPSQRLTKYDLKKSKVSRKKSSGNSAIVKFKSSNDDIDSDGLTDWNGNRYYSKLRTLSLMPNNDIRRPSLIQQGKEKLELHFCRITVLLVMMQLGLGSSMASLGLYLHNLSPKLTLRDCPYWAAFPLFFTGLLGMSFCSSEQHIFEEGIISNLLRNSCALFSTLSAILCSIASGLTGHHGNWLAYYSIRCPTNLNDQILKHTLHNHPDTLCCQTISKPKPIHMSCECGYFQEVANQTTQIVANKWNPVISYFNVNCYYVFSGLKDYLILQCALYAVAAGASAWLSILIWSNRAHDRSKNLIITRNSYARRRIKQMQENNIDTEEFKTQQINFEDQDTEMYKFYQDNVT